jgi:vacuolar protein sorting-associated protein 45
MVFSQSESNAKEVFLFQNIESDKKSEVTHLKAVCFLRPTAANITALLGHLREPRFSEYHLCTNLVLSLSCTTFVPFHDQLVVVIMNRFLQHFAQEFSQANRRG